MVQQFPRELLEKSLSDRHEYFRKYTVSHPAFEEAYEGLLDRINNGSKNSIILVYGTSGVGKTKLIEKVQEKLIEDNIETYINNRGLFPTLTVEAVPPDSGSFDWKDFYYRCLVMAEEPLIDYKISIEEKVENRELKNDGKAALRRSLENVLIFRKPIAFFIDEAQHISMTTNSRKLRNQINILKSLANMTNVPIVLSGNYDLITYRDLNGQTIRRGKDVHIKRYNAKNKDELKSFINVLLAFQQHLPLEEEPDLITNWDYFYSRSIGCIGILKDWLYSTYQTSTRNNPSKKTLEIEDFKCHELTPGRSIKLLKEATEGEKKYEKSVNQEEELYRQLGLIEETESYGTDEDEVKTEGENKKNKKPGERKAQRDHVGVNEINEAL
ncbi:ATP-binding protein [Robertmurraya massiliosenegalensis]|uniref:ATP-binding protein n=1 Tax=Robertmurraya massiliosenegalensis TaxID=1287657 RepID=UPI0003008289|nr:ATP-binding protein [Robertmurraya massiliosenegalensis]